MGRAILSLKLEHLQRLLQGEMVIRVCGAPRELKILSAEVRPQHQDVCFVVESPDVASVPADGALLCAEAFLEPAPGYRLHIGSLL